MADIKQKKKNDTVIKKFEKAKIFTQKVKDNIVTIKEKENNSNNRDDSVYEYGANKLSEKENKIIKTGTNKINKYGVKALNETKKNFDKLKKRLKRKIYKKKLKNNSIRTKRIAKKMPKTAKKTFKVTTKTTKKAIKGVKKAYQIAKATAKTTIKGIKAGVRATVSAVKTIILTTKAIIAALIAGGWIVVLIIVIICLIGLICSSVFGIFFSNEKGVGDKKIGTVMSELNSEFNNKIIEIQHNNVYDDYEINSNKAEWKDIISVYAVIVTGGKEQSDVITLDDKKIEKLKNIFWEMNVINYHIQDIEKDIEIINDDGSTKIERQTRKTLFIDITNVSKEEMSKRYNFTKEQIEQLNEVSKEKYASLWSNVLYGATNGSTDIVEVARSQLGNVGGQPYWSWYGFSARVSWCACFVSWCAEQCGYIQAGIIPKFAGCQLEGVNWFKACGLWQDGGYIPKSGDIIFFDWNESKDGFSDHVGIVEKVENGRVYTIEGNSSNACRQRDYDINSGEIQGYGTPMY